MYKRLVVTHDNCVDGCCSRAIFEDLFKEDAEYLQIDHGDYNKKFPERVEKLNNILSKYTNADIYMADICLPTEYILPLLERNNSVVILDHHDTALTYINELMEFKKEHPNAKIDINFSYDNSESGALLTWNYVHKNKKTPDVITYVSEGDVWKFFHPNTKYFYTGLLDNQQPNDYSPEFWQTLLQNEEIAENFVQKGIPIREQFLEQVQVYVDKAVPIKLEGKNGSIVFCPSEYRSEAGNLISLQNGGFALLIEEEADFVKCSLRSTAPVVCNDIAKAHQGGGHKQAAAFRVSNLDELQEIISKENDINIYNLKSIQSKKNNFC